jgi:molybdopterin-containing oxidoreductase family membrane subunit
MAEILGVLGDPKHTVAAIHRLQDSGFKDLEVYSPVPSHDIEHALERGPSRVRAWTLIGGLTGVSVGYLFTIWTSYDWPLVIGGKPFASIPAYTVIAFELTILLGGILTVLGLITHGMIGTIGRHTPYRPQFSSDQFGCVVRCHADQIPRVQELLSESGCTEVRVVEG